MKKIFITNKASNLGSVSVKMGLKKQCSCGDVKWILA